MKIITVNKPLQDSNTPSHMLELVEYYESYNDVDGVMELKQYIPTWCVRSDRFKLGETFREWIQRMELEIERKEKKLGIKIEGMYLYDIPQMYQGIVFDGSITNHITNYPRYDYIKPKPF